MTGKVVIAVEDISKFYRLGTIGGGTLHEDVARWWAKMRGRPDPLLKIGEQDHGNRVGEHLWALRHVSLDVREGDVLGVIGRNGAGKSTLLKILSRITAPTSGRAVIRGRVGSLLEVGTGFHPELTGRENVYLNGAILGMRRAEIKNKIDEIVDFAEMTRFIDTPVKRYSSGMTVRLAFAVAAHLDPEILIIDEVLAVGDAKFQERCLAKMHQISTEGRTILFVSHNLAAVRKLCTRAMVLNKGVKSSDGTVTEAIETYLDPEAADCAEISWLREEAPGDSELVLMSAKALLVEQQGSRYPALIVRLELEADVDLDGVDLSTIVRDARGVEVAHGATHLQKGFDGLQKGTNIIEYVLPAVFLTSKYFVTLVAAIPNRHSYFHLVDVLAITAATSDHFSHVYQGHEWRSVTHPTFGVWRRIDHSYRVPEGG